MRAYLLSSGSLFTFVAGAWLLRLALAVPLRVNSVEVPVWLSVVPILAAGSLAAWAFRLARGTPRA